MSWVCGFYTLFWDYTFLGWIVLLSTHTQEKQQWQGFINLIFDFTWVSLVCSLSNAVSGVFELGFVTLRLKLLLVKPGAFCFLFPTGGKWKRETLWGKQSNYSYHRIKPARGCSADLNFCNKSTNRSISMGHQSNGLPSTILCRFTVSLPLLCHGISNIQSHELTFANKPRVRILSNFISQPKHTIN